MPFLLNREAKKMLSARSFADHHEILRMMYLARNIKLYIAASIEIDDLVPKMVKE